MTWLGLDIGGANLKAATARGWAVSRPFPLWKHPHRLADALTDLLTACPEWCHLAVTMTGELADCYKDKRDGVEQIVGAVIDAAAGRTTRFYRTDGQWVGAAAAIEQPLLVAAANWHALGQFAVRYATSFPALMLDIGSTTTDLIPLEPHGPDARGTTDWLRLLERELVYTGVERTPVCVVAPSVWIGPTATVQPSSTGSAANPRLVHLAAEWFATMKDVYLLLGDLPADESDHETADGRPATPEWACGRLRRMVCADTSELPDSELLHLAKQAADRQVQHVAEAIEAVAGRRGGVQQFVLSGHGSFLARRAIERFDFQLPCVTLETHIGASASRSATAYALAHLADEQFG